MRRRDFIWALITVPALAPSPLSAAEGRRLRRVTVKTGSMLPALPIDSTLVVDTGWYQANDVQRFDVVLLTRRRPRHPGGAPVADQLVARVIGLPGEVVSVRKGMAYIGEQALKEPMPTLPCAEEDEVPPCGVVGPVRVPAGEYYLLADNRGESEDSRLWRPATVPGADILGKVADIISPVAATQLLVAPEPAQRAAPVLPC